MEPSAILGGSPGGPDLGIPRSGLSRAFVGSQFGANMKPSGVLGGSPGGPDLGIPRSGLSRDPIWSQVGSSRGPREVQT